MPPLQTITLERADNQSQVLCNATPGVWSLLEAEYRGRSGLVLQNKNAASFFFLLADTAPPNGTQPGEFEVPATPATYQFPFIPSNRNIYVRSTVANHPIAVMVW